MVCRSWLLELSSLCEEHEIRSKTVIDLMLNSVNLLGRRQVSLRLTLLLKSLELL